MIAIGIDIAKKKVDVYMNNKSTVVANEKGALKQFFDPIKRDGVKIVMEATGRYHRLAHQVISNLGFDIMVINPYQSRHFAKSMNVLCKTDNVDAKILSQYAQRMDFKKTPAPTPIEEKLQDLVRYLDDLKEMLMQYEHRLEDADDVVRESLERLIKSIKKEIQDVTKKIEKLIKSDSQLSQRCELLTSIPGIGNTSAAVLVGLVKELGTISNKEVVALVGLAPMNNDSGFFKGKRRIQKGRHDVRRFLYMPAMGAATQHNPRLNVFYNKLIAAGKPAKVAIVACMRKLIIFANTLLKKGEKWAPKNLPARVG